MKPEDLIAIATPMTNNLVQLVVAQNTLVSSVVAFLTEKGVIDYEEYMDYNAKTQEKLVNQINESDFDDDEKKIKEDFLKMIFELHRNKLS